MEIRYMFFIIEWIARLLYGDDAIDDASRPNRPSSNRKRRKK